MNSTNRARSPWFWVPTLYFAQGLPYVAVMTISVIFYKRLGLSNTEIALYTSWLYLPWVIKPLWSPVVDMLKTRRLWILAMQWLVGGGLAGVALTIPTTQPVQWTLAFFWLMAFSSATHDIAADGFYMLGLNKHQQTWFVGVRSTFYRIAMIAGQGLLVMLAGALEKGTGNIQLAWSVTFLVLAAFFLLTAGWHAWSLPKPPSDVPKTRGSLAVFFREFGITFASFFQKPGAPAAVAFLLLYRFAEAQLVKIASLFLLDARSAGGLSLSTAEVGVVYGTVGVIALTLGGLLGGFAAARNGLKFWLPWMVMAINLPNAVYIFLAWARPESLWVVNACVAVEQFGYGFGFAAYMLFLLYYAQGPHQTAHYAIGTGLMALGMMLPGMLSGWIEDQLGYLRFFIWVLVATAVSFTVALCIRVDPEFGRKP